MAQLKWIEAEGLEWAGLCPICGEAVMLEGKTADGRLIGSCKDAFTAEQWKWSGSQCEKCRRELTREEMENPNTQVTGLCSDCWC